MTSYIRYLTKGRRMSSWEKRNDAELTAAQAGAALRKSLASIKANGESEAAKAEATAVSLKQCADHLKKHFGEAEATEMLVAAVKASRENFPFDREAGDEAKLEDDDDGDKEDGDGDEDNDDGDDVEHPDQAASEVADLLVEIGAHPSRSHALAYLFHSPHGAALLQRLRGMSKKQEDTTTMEEGIAKVIKEQGGILAFAKKIATVCDCAGFSEHDLSAAITTYAKAKYPKLSEAQAFARVFMEGEDGLVLRKALEVAKQASWLSVMPQLPANTDPAYREAMSKQVAKATAAR